MASGNANAAACLASILGVYRSAVRLNGSSHDAPVPSSFPVTRLVPRISERKRDASGLQRMNRLEPLKRSCHAACREQRVRISEGPRDENCNGREAQQPRHRRPNQKATVERVRRETRATGETRETGARRETGEAGAAKEGNGERRGDRGRTNQLGVIVVQPEG